MMVFGVDPTPGSSVLQAGNHLINVNPTLGTHQLRQRRTAPFGGFDGCVEVLDPGQHRLLALQDLRVLRLHELYALVQLFLLTGNVAGHILDFTLPATESLIA